MTTRGSRRDHAPPGGAVATVRAVVALARDRNLTGLAAGIAYYAFVSVIPLVLLSVAVASIVSGDALAERVTALIGEGLSASGQDSVTQTLTDTTGRGAASVVGLLTLLWGGLKLFRALDLAFDDIYPQEVDTSLPEQVRDGLVVLTGIALAVTLVVGVGLALRLLAPDVPGVDALGTVVLIAVLTVTLLPVYYVLPPVSVSVREVLPGAALAAVGWVVLQFVFALYAANAGQYAAYGLLGAILLFVTWLYFASIVVLLGATLNAVRRGAGPT